MYTNDIFINYNTHEPFEINQQTTEKKAQYLDQLFAVMGKYPSILTFHLHVLGALPLVSLASGASKLHLSP